MKQMAQLRTPALRSDSVVCAPAPQDLPFEFKIICEDLWNLWDKNENENDDENSRSSAHR